MIVSTEDPEIASVARAFGAEVIDRPAELATDTAATDDVLLHALEQVPDAALVVLLQPTVPVREPGLIDNCVDYLTRRTDLQSVMTGNRLHFVHWRYAIGKQWFTNDPLRRRRQEIGAVSEERWLEDGSVYVVRAQALREARCRIVEPREVMPADRTVDIDTERDFRLAETLLKERLPEFVLYTPRLEASA